MGCPSLMSESVSKSLLAGCLRCCRHSAVMGLMLLSHEAGADAVDAERQSIRIAMLQEPPSLDSTRATDLVSFFVLGHINEGLVRYGRRGRLMPGVAESWTLLSDRIEFKLRDDARWEDGTPVTARDFVYAWRQVVDPKVASPFAAIMQPFKNAQAIREGELPVSALGIRAVDDQTLVVELERPCGYCLGMMPHTVFYPVKRSFHRQAGEGYATEADQILSNGPFRLTEWVHEASLRFEKNAGYWNRDQVFLNEIDVAYISSDNRTRLNLFLDGQTAFVRLGAETVKEAVGKGQRVRTFLSGGVTYLWFNHRDGLPMTSKLLRRAVQSAFNTDEYVNQVIAIPGYRPTRTLFPSYFDGMEKSFVKEFPPPEVNHDPAHARALLVAAGKELGEIPRLRLLTVTSTTGVRAAEYIQGKLRQTLGLDVLVDQQTFKQYLSRARAGEFDLALSSWYPDYDDFVTYADLLGSHNPNNRGRYFNDEYDRWLKVLMESIDKKTRLNAVAELQRIIVEEVPLLPTAETGSAYLVHPRLRGVTRRVLGQDPDFTSARVLPKGGEKVTSRAGSETRVRNIRAVRATVSSTPME